jgi:hypothetical protein
MTVEELIAELRGCPQDAIVILAADSEGNAFSPLHEDYEGNGFWHPYDLGAGEFHGAHEIGDPDYDYEGPGSEGQPAICLWPVR